MQVAEPPAPWSMNFMVVGRAVVDVMTDSPSSEMGRGKPLLQVNDSSGIVAQLGNQRLR